MYFSDCQVFDSGGQGEGNKWQQLHWLLFSDQKWHLVIRLDRKGQNTVIIEENPHKMKLY